MRIIFEEVFMVFSSMVFLWIFLPVVFVLSFLIRKPKYQNIVLLAASLLFYAWGEPRNIILLLVSIFLNWVFGLLIDRCRERGKLFLTLDILVNLGLLGYFKYTDFFINTINHVVPGAAIPLANIALPIGISFFTFQAMSYVIDLYRGQIKVQKNLLYLALYVSFFPQLIAGPIVKYRDIEVQIENRRATMAGISSGFRRFVYGLGKKVLISNLIAQAADNLYGLEVSSLTGGMAWLCALTYTLQIYYDSPVTRIWPSDSAECSALSFWRTSTTPTSARPSVNSGRDGTFRSAPGFRSICTFRLEETGRGRFGRM